MQHAGSVVQVEQQILDAGAEIIWVLVQSGFGQPGTATECLDLLDSLGSELGWCVGDGETQPTPTVFDNSPFSVGRGFDIIVPRDSMRIEWVSNHGTPQGNENLDGEAVLAAVQDVIGG